MPANTVYVGRPTRWGNPYKVTEYSRKDAIKLYEQWLRNELKLFPGLLDPLKGKNLACFCSLDEPCHADVILKILKETEIGRP